jgi:hypothetical protein
VTRRDVPRIVVVGAIVFAVGLAIDLWWHATHSGFERASDQIQAHAVLWIGTAVLLGAGLWGAAARAPSRGYAALIAATTFYATVHVWHFSEHLQHRDPNLPHVLLLAGLAAILGSIGLVMLER